MNVRGVTSILVKDESDDLLLDSYSILNWWKNFLCQVLNAYRFNDVMKIEIHTAELLVPAPSYFEVETSIGKLKRYKLPGADQVSADFKSVIIPKFISKRHVVNDDIILDLHQYTRIYLFFGILAELHVSGTVFYHQVLLLSVLHCTTLLHHLVCY
jgi:hypothetical protein